MMDNNETLGKCQVCGSDPLTILFENRVRCLNVKCIMSQSSYTPLEWNENIYEARERLGSLISDLQKEIEDLENKLYDGEREVSMLEDEIASLEEEIMLMEENMGSSYGDLL